MAEWSNALDLSSSSFGSAGSNPAGDTFYKKPHSNHLLFLESTTPMVSVKHLFFCSAGVVGYHVCLTRIRSPVRIWCGTFLHDIVSERLRRWTANPLGYARAGSNPADVAFWFLGQGVRRRSRKPKIASSNLAGTC